MSEFNWSNAAQTFSDFGGQQKTFHIPKTGLPFFDVLRLYGAIELFVGLQEEVFIHDEGNEWGVSARVREHRLKGLQEIATTLKKKKLSKKDEEWIGKLKMALNGDDWPTEPLRDVSTPLDNPDSALKDGVRNTAASTYKGLETGYGKESKVPFADALLAYAGQERTESIAGIYFLPVFEGKVDFSKVISPLRAWIGIPNVLCAQALTLLALKTSLFAEGYADKLSAVVYNTNFDPRGFYNYSGIIKIESTALSNRYNISQDFVGHFYRIFRSLLGRAWKREGQTYKAKPQIEDAFAHAYWLMQPSHPKNLSTLINSLERQKRYNKLCIIAEPYLKKSYVKEVFQMSYGKWEGDHEAVRKFARAVATGIYHARLSEPSMKKEERGKAWYDEVVMLRSAPTAKAFFERAMILLEQGRRKNQFIASASNSEDFDPVPLMSSIGNSRSSFETFRDLFRMYLILESVPKSRKAEAKIGDEDGLDTTLLDEFEDDEKGDEQ
jgi:hypothetical protein